MLKLQEGETIPLENGRCLHPVLDSGGHHVKEAVLLYHAACCKCGAPVVVRLSQYREAHWKTPAQNSVRRCVACRLT